VLKALVNAKNTASSSNATPRRITAAMNVLTEALEDFVELHNASVTPNAVSERPDTPVGNARLETRLNQVYPLIAPSNNQARAREVSIDPIFEHAQGSEAFLRECDAYLRANIKEMRIGCPTGSDAPKAMAYQKTIAKLFNDRTPVRRLLAVAQLGAGKTFMMLKVLNNYIERPLAKICIFPTQTTVDNFYWELLKFKNKHRTWLEKQLGKSLSDRVSDSTMDKCRKLLWSPPAGTIAPLRVYRVTLFGALMKDSAIFGKRRVYEPLWLIDEVHNFVAPSKKVLGHSLMLANLKKMREFMYNTSHRLIGFTATPIVDDPSQGMELLKIIKGKHNLHAGNAGFTSWYMARSPAVFASASDFPNVIDVVVDGPPLIEAMAKKKNRDLYLHTTFYFAGQQKNIDKITKAASVYAPKLDRIAEDIARFNQKTVVLIERAQGLRALAAILQTNYKVKTLVFEGDVPGERSREYTLWKTAMDNFNAPENDHGERYQVAVCDAATYSEGVSFKSVRLIVLAGIAERYGLMQQRLGRALRSCSHTRLPESERTLQQLMYRIVLPDKYIVKKKMKRGSKKTSNNSNMYEHRPVNVESLDSKLYKKLQIDKPKVDQAMCELASFAVDRAFLGMKNTCS